jgi:hypothetical protein
MINAKSRRNLAPSDDGEKASCPRAVRYALLKDESYEDGARAAITI